MQKLLRVLHFIDSASEWVGKVCSFAMLIIMVVICYEVGARYVFNKSTLWAHEASTYTWGVYFMLGGAYALAHRAHVNMDLLYSHLSPRKRAILDLVTSVLFFLFIGVLMWQAGPRALTAIERWEHSGSPWDPPTYPVRIAIVVAALLLLLQGSAKFIRDLIIARAGEKAHEL